MQVTIAENYQALSKQAAEIVAAQIINKPTSVLGLATGVTPLGMYEELVSLHKAGLVSFKEVTTFNLDEFVGISPLHPGSYHQYMRHRLFDHVDINIPQAHLPNGAAPNLKQECREYEAKIRKAGGIDLQVLGIGRNGHIGFNEPHGKFEAFTNVVTLDSASREANARFFSTPHEVPRQAITMGIRTIMQARTILLLASGFEKAQVLAKALEGPVTPAVPASVLQLHSNVVVLADEAAAQIISKINTGQAAIDFG